MSAEPVTEQVEQPQEREEALDNLCNHVRVLLAANDTSELDSLHSVGTSIVDASRQALYGDQVTKEVAKRLNTYRQKIQFSVRFASAYDTAGFDSLKSMITESGEAYRWSVTHVRFLLRVKNESEREALAAECARSNWPCRKLEEEVKTCLGQTDTTSSTATDISSILKRLQTLCNDYKDFVGTLASPGSNLADRIAASSRSLTENQKSLLRTLKEQFPAFTERMCEVNGYLSQIELS